MAMMTAQKNSRPGTAMVARNAGARKRRGYESACNKGTWA